MLYRDEGYETYHRAGSRKCMGSISIKFNDNCWRDSMTIPSEQEIYDMAKIYGLKLVKGVDVISNLEICIDAFNDFLQLSENIGKKLVYEDAYYYDEEILSTYMIDPEQADTPKLKRRIKEYNTKIMSTPVDKPASIELFIIDEKTKYFIFFEEEWSNINDPEDALIELERSAEINKMTKEPLYLDPYKRGLFRSKKTDKNNIAGVIYVELPSMEEIFNKVTAQGIGIFKGKIHKEEADNLASETPRPNFLLVDVDTDLNGFLNIVKTMNKKFFFINAESYDSQTLEEKLIDTSALQKEIPSVYWDKVRKLADEYNAFVKNTRTGESYLIELFIVDGDTVYDCSMYADWYRKLLNSEEAIQRIYDECKESAADIRLKKLKEFEQEIIENKVFRNCTTKDARKYFVHEYLNDKGFYSHSMHELEEWADFLWAVYKANK